MKLIFILFLQCLHFFSLKHEIQSFGICEWILYSLDWGLIKAFGNTGSSSSSTPLALLEYQWRDFSFERWLRFYFLEPDDFEIFKFFTSINNQLLPHTNCSQNFFTPSWPLSKNIFLKTPSSCQLLQCWVPSL